MVVGFLSLLLSIINFLKFKELLKYFYIVIQKPLILSKTVSSFEKVSFQHNPPPTKKKIEIIE